jgi:pimeloyl-ACP methyl ester carboxylesterase
LNKLTVIFNHGRESGPWGTKIRTLARIAEQAGCQVLSRDDSDTRDPELRVERLIAEAAALDGPLVLVGSSMGGYVAAVAAQQVRAVGLFLMAPALGLPGYAVAAPEPDCSELELVHGWDDELISVDSVVAFAREHCARLHLVPAGHTLVEQLDWLAQTFAHFLRRCSGQSGCAVAGRLLATL